MIRPMETRMKWGSALVEGSSFEKMMGEGIASIRKQMGEGPIDIAFLFVSPHFQRSYEEVPAWISEKLCSRNLLGCSAGGMIGGGREREQKPAISLLAARLPGVTIKVYHLENKQIPELDTSPQVWQGLLSIPPSDSPQFVLIADPSTFYTERFLMGLDFAYPRSVKIGGVASGRSSNGATALFLTEKVQRAGLVGVAFTGNLAIDTVIAQGCRPIGVPASITEADRNLLLRLDGRPPLEYLQELIHTLDPQDQELARHSLFLGIAMTPLKEDPGRGDFLIRNLMEMDPQTGAIAIGALLREGQMVQFHLRDAETSAEDLHLMLSSYLSQQDARKAEGALLFSCLGRGEHLYGHPDHDSQVFHSRIGPIPLGGFFCNGEIGAVGGSTFLHGYTSCFGIFRPNPS